MLWRKKKSVDPQRAGLPRTTAAQSTSLEMTEVYALSYAAALQRGYPGAVADAIAGRVLWLERRGLPGVIALTREFVANKDTTPVERGTNCPFIAGTLLMDQFDLFVGRDIDRQLAIAGPTNGVLILPKVAEYAARIGETVRVSWLKGEPPEVIGETIVGADGAVVFIGDVCAALFNSGVAFVRDGSPGPASTVQTGAVPRVSNASVPDEVIAPLISFIGRDRLEAALKVHTLLSEDAATLALLHMLTDADRSLIRAPGDGMAGEHVVLTTTPGSTNDKLWTRFASYGWTAPFRPKGATGALAQHSVSDEGRALLPMVLSALDRFPPTKH